MSDERPVTPARPHLKLTDDGRRMREVLSYSRRGSRFTPKQQQAWEAYAERWVIPDEAVDAQDFDLAHWFGRSAPLIVEIGPGVGEATGVLAAQRPDLNVLALEVWRPGVAAGLAEAANAGAENVRFCSVDAAWFLEHLIAREGLAELWTFFPDPWPKTRHHKRRLVDAEFARLVAGRLAPGGLWRLATDWADYAEQMQAVLDAEPMLDGGRVARWADRPVTKFERKGIAVDREIVDLCYRRAK
ncbi:MAG: tRNA (guanosine(46)-N7)-methyltransferase TrmB [Nocardioides sp.]